jgi:hypothetical protein
MTAPCLYVNSKGQPWRKHSYSAGLDFDQAPLKYYLKRVLGWKEKDNRGSFKFGRAVEESIQAYHDSIGELDIAEDFVRRWSVHKEDGNIKFTDAEKNWANCEVMGRDMVRLYKIMQPSLPIPLGGRSVFQREYSRTVFGGDPNYGGIEDAGKIDIICYVEPEHPKLPKITWRPEFGAFRSLIVDIKTAQQDYPEQPGISAFDSQLRRYSNLSGIRTVAMLWLVKKGLGLKKGYSITLLEPAGQFQAGEEGVIARVEDDHAYIVKNDFMVSEMDRIQGKKGEKLDQTNEAKQRAQNWVEQYGTKVRLTAITKQRLQFNAGIVSDQSAKEAGEIAARQIVGIVNAWKNQSWPNTFGIRYPHDDQNDAYFRAFVLGDESFKQSSFIKSSEKDFDELFEDQETE